MDYTDKQVNILLSCFTLAQVMAYFAGSGVNLMQV